MRALARLAMVAFAAVGVPASAQPSSPPSATNPALIAATLEAAVGCAVAAGPESIDRGRFEGSADWLADVQLPGFRHASMPIAITFVPALDAAPTRCEVRATLASQEDQRQMALALRVLLPQPPVDQDGGELWRFGRSPNGRSLFMVRDAVRPQPEIRFVGMAF